MTIRNHAWLEIKLKAIVDEYFPDLLIKNQLTIRFGKRSRRQLGCIAKKYTNNIIDRLRGDFSSEIRINGLFRDPEIPEEVVEGTIIHELCHYAHGFSSPLPQLSKYPHQGGVIKQEMIRRGAGDIYLAEKKWLRKNWQEYLNNLNSKFKF